MSSTTSPSPARPTPRASSSRRIGLAIAALALASSGCATVYQPTRIVDHFSAPSAQKAYVYGRFRLNEGGASFNPWNQASFGLVIGCADGATYTIDFIGDYPSVFAVSPSTCAAAHVLFVEHHHVGDVKVLPDTLRRGLVLEAGHAYYLGDISLDVYRANRVDSFGHAGAADNFEQTTKDMLIYWPDFAKVPRVKALLFPRTPDP